MAICVLAVSLLVFAACSSTTRPSVFEVRGDPGSTKLGCGIDSCNQNPRVDAQQTSTEVRLTVTADAASGAHCADGVEVTLTAPLGDREVVDVASGDRLELSGSGTP